MAVDPLLIGRMIAAVEDGRPTAEILRMALRATASLGDARRAADLMDGLATPLRLIDESSERGWPVDLLRQNAIDAIWRIHSASRH